MSKQYRTQVEILGFSDYRGLVYADSKREAQMIALSRWMEQNDIEPGGTEDEQISFYSPTAVLAR